jgi:hypothetical protein
VSQRGFRVYLCLVLLALHEVLVNVLQISDYLNCRVHVACVAKVGQAC